MTKESDKKYARVCGSDEYGREAWLMVNKDNSTGKICVLSSEEGDPVMYSPKEVRELIEVLKGYLK